MIIFNSLTFFMLQNIKKYRKLFLQKGFYQNKKRFPNLIISHVIHITANGVKIFFNTNKIFGLKFFKGSIARNISSCPSSFVHDLSPCSAKQPLTPFPTTLLRLQYKTLGPILQQHQIFRAPLKFNPIKRQNLETDGSSCKFGNMQVLIQAYMQDRLNVFWGLCQQL